MIFIVGGASQGKRDFAAKMFMASGKVGPRYFREAEKQNPGYLLEAKKQSSVNLPETGEQNLEYLLEAEKQKFVDGGEASWEVFRKARYACRLQLMIRRKLKAGEDGRELEKAMAAQLTQGCPDRILLMDEIGCGIIPVDAFERQYRELAGRIGCRLAAEADEVWRVIAGIGKRLR